MWRPDTSSKEPTQNSSPATAPKPKSRRAKGKTKTQDKGKGKDTEFDHGPLESASAATRLRIVWIRVHPVAFDDVFKALQEAASLTLSDVNRQGQEAEIELADLRGQLNVFEITGPKANQVIKGSLSPVGEDQRGEFKKVTRLPIVMTSFRPSLCSCSSGPHSGISRPQARCLVEWSLV
jgi:ribonuclease P/MRP protein subunit POP1